MRHICSGKQAHLCKALRIQKGQVCRCDRDRQKEKALTGGGLGIDSVSMRQEVSRIVVVTGNELQQICGGLTEVTKD
jgi:hypothetical protein